MNTDINGYPDLPFGELSDFYRNCFNEALEKSCEKFAPTGSGYEALGDAMSYSLKAGGKRIRPILVFEFCRMCKGKLSDALPAALAIEMIHTFSLIHDDLPCMDNDDFRRGRPSCHKAHGEAVALLAGDALPFEACLSVADSSLEPKKAIKVVSVLSECSLGMIGGQTIDIGGANTENLLKMYSLKTSMLIKAACVCGCICAGADKRLCALAGEYAYELGLAFQITDDILDVTGNEQILGKPVGSDEKSDKVTYVSLFGQEKAKKAAAEHTERALSLLDGFDDNEYIRRLSTELLDRDR